MKLKLFRSTEILSSRSFIARLVLGLILLNLTVLGLAVWSLHQSRLQYEESASVATQNLARLIEHDLSASVRMIDLALLAVKSEAERQMLAGGLKGPALNAFIRQQIERQPDLDGLRVTNAQGVIIHGTAVVTGAGASLGDREYFLRLRNDPKADLVISKPILGRTSGKWVIVLARRLQRPDGSFAGMVYGTIALTHFTKVFSSLQVGPGGSLSLFDDDFRLVARQPEPAGLANSVGTRFGSPQLQALVKSGQSEGVFKGRSVVDNVERIASYRKIPGTQFNIVIGLASHDYLAEWRNEVGKTIARGTAFVLMTVLLSWLLNRAWKNQASAVAALREVNRTLDVEKQLNQTIVQSSPLAIYTRDRNGRVTAWNLAAEKLFGWRADEIVGKPLLSVPPGKEKETEALRQKVLRGENIIQMEVQRQKRDGTLFDLSTTLAPLRDGHGEINGYLAIATDITERKASEKQIEFLAYRDVLTGLPNRLLLHDRFEHAVGFAERSGTKLALLFLDLDNFKTINDSLGHAVGDLLLKEIARRLGDCVRDTDTISRQGGDEFLIVLPDLRGADAITPVLLKIRERLQAPFELDGHELTTSASVGVAIYPDDGLDFDTLLKKADTAMYRAKDGGRNSYRFFDEQMNVEAVEHLHLKNGLRRAIERAEFVLHYQPQIDLSTGSIVGAEALLRWNHPEFGMIPPARFIPVAEDSGLIVPIGEWVISEACRQGVAWRAAGLPPLVMAVNLSAVQFKRGDVEQTVTQALKSSGFDPQLLELELTESILIHNTDNVLATVQRLKLLGVKLSIDDFGTGYSSLSYLKRFDVDKLKIDQSFIRDLGTDPDDAAIILAIIQMARSLNLKTIAEGVETAEMLSQLQQFKCDEAQGYYFARPMPAQVFADFVVAHSARQPAPNGEWAK
jgi:diguanylate cyclase (GGDEF)-like protein/PAS domain S-box-containing protein